MLPKDLGLQCLFKGIGLNVRVNEDVVFVNNGHLLERG